MRRNDTWLVVAAISCSLWAIALAVTLAVSVIWGVKNPAKASELMRNMANRVDPLPTLKVASTCTLQGHLDAENPLRWEDLVQAKASDWNSEDVIVPPGMVKGDAPLRIVASFGTQTRTP